MLGIKNYVRVQSVEEAYELCQKKNNVVLGGMLWLKMQNRAVNTAIDLCDLGLDKIEEDEDHYIIGAMVSLRSLEQHQGLNELTQGSVRDAVKHIVGVQFRNLATVGGSLYGRFGFSDVLTIFQVLGAKIELHNLGMLTVDEFSKLPRSTRDILVRVWVPKKAKQVVYFSHRNTATDFPVLTCAISKTDDTYVCSIGARPGLAVVHKDENAILANGITEESTKAFADYIVEHTKFSSNVRGSEEYRACVCKALVERALTKIKEV